MTSRTSPIFFPVDCFEGLGLTRLMQVQEGQGWRLLVDPARHPFVVLIGGADWATELTAQEAQTLRKGFGQLLQQHAAIADQLMEEESISLELDLGGLWIAIEGDRSSWQARFVLTPGDGQRGLEGGWDAAASQAVAAALAQSSDLKDWQPGVMAAEKAVSL